MASVGFDVEDESQPSISNGKKFNAPGTVPDDGRAVNHSSVPRKLRSAIKKRGRKSSTPQSVISRKPYHVPNRFEKHRKDGGKKSKPNMKQGRITKDEEEVAETLYALAGMFSDANRANQSGSNDEPPEPKSSATQEAGRLMNAIEDTGIQSPHEESTETASKLTLDVTRHSSDLVDSTGEVIKFHSPSDVQKPELPTCKQPAASSASGDQYKSLDSRPRVSALSPIPSSDKNTGSFVPSFLSARRGVSPETPVSYLRLSKSTNYVSDPFLTENRVTAEKHSQATESAESKRLRKRCSAHVHICHLIKALQVSVGKESLLEKPTQTTDRIAGQQTHVSTHSQMTETNGKIGCLPFSAVAHSTAPSESAEIQNDTHMHKRLRQDQQLTSETPASCSSTYQGYDFLSLGHGVIDMDVNKSMNTTKLESPARYHTPNMHSQSHAAVLFSLPQNGYSSTYQRVHNSVLTAQQVHLPQYPSHAAINARMVHPSDSHQHKWVAEFPTHYSTGATAITSPQVSNAWRNGGRDPRPMVSYSHAVFPHLAAMGSKLQQFSPTQQQVMGMNPSELGKRHQVQFPLGFERNGTFFYQDSIQQLQRPCNQHLSN